MPETQTPWIDTLPATWYDHSECNHVWSGPYAWNCSPALRTGTRAEYEAALDAALRGYEPTPAPRPAIHGESPGETTTIDMPTLVRAALAVVATIDYEATFYAPEAQHPAEDWALDALQDALAGNTDEANAKIDRYDGAGVEIRRAYPNAPDCIYCGSPAWIIDAAPIDDDDGWTVRAGEHDADCEWIATRAHQAAAFTAPAD